MVSRSSAKAEYCALTHTTFELVWLCHLLHDMSIHLKQPTPLYCDNKSAIYIAHNDVFHERSKHIEIECHFVRQHVKSCAVDLQSVSSTNQLADFFTKSHFARRFMHLLSKLSILPPAHCELEGGCETT